MQRKRLTSLRISTDPVVTAVADAESGPSAETHLGSAVCRLGTRATGPGRRRSWPPILGERVGELAGERWGAVSGS